MNPGASQRHEKLLTGRSVILKCQESPYQVKVYHHLYISTLSRQSFAQKHPGLVFMTFTLQAPSTALQHLNNLVGVTEQQQTSEKVKSFIVALVSRGFSYYLCFSTFLTLNGDRKGLYCNIGERVPGEYKSLDYSCLVNCNWMICMIGKIFTAKLLQDCKKEILGKASLPSCSPQQRKTTEHQTTSARKKQTPLSVFTFNRLGGACKCFINSLLLQCFDYLMSGFEQLFFEYDTVPEDYKATLSNCSFLSQAREDDGPTCRRYMLMLAQTMQVWEQH